MMTKKDFLNNARDCNINTLKDAFKNKEIEDIDVAGSFGWTALHLAIFKGCESTVKLLIKNGISLTAQSDDGKSPMHWAVSANNPKIFEALLKAGAPMDMTDKSGNTAENLLYKYNNRSMIDAYNKFKKSKKVGKFARLLR